MSLNSSVLAESFRTTDNPLLVEGPRLQEIIDRSLPFSSYKAPVSAKPGQTQIEIPLETSRGRPFCLYITSRNTKSPFGSPKSDPCSLRCLKIQMQNQPAYFMYSRGVDEIQVAEVVPEQSGVQEILIRYKNKGYFLWGAHLISLPD